MRSWNSITLGEVLPFKYGKNLPASKRTHSGEYDVVSSAGIIDSHDTAFTTEPCIVIGRKGSIGSLTYCPDPVWPTDTTFYVTGTPYCDLRFGYYVLQTLPLNQMNNDSAVPGLNRNDAESLAFSLPPVSEQKTIAKVLGSLDDKIAGNNKMIRIILELQKSIWIQNNVKNLSQIHLINIAEPILGGTPKRSDNSLWNGDILWASVADMTSVSNSHLLTTAEQITEKAAETKRFAPLPAGSVLLSARGTVGHVISLAKPAAFNQSAYGFIAPKGYETALRLAIGDTVEELKSKSYGSVFSTITKQQINECLIPDVFNESFAELHAKLNSLETRIVIAEQENQTLARTRDELLPLLMSGKITVRDAEEASAEVGVDKHEVEE
ncbi:MAG: restriction endonuclease subunit S [Corynebacterium sp.]|nr:MAG: restriction endonuclease subunit S [Corynebacterium sp.]